MKFLINLSDVQKGTLLMIIGLILFLHTTGLWTRGLNTIIVLGSIAMAVCGFVMSGYYQKLVDLVKKKQQ